MSNFNELLSAWQLLPNISIEWFRLQYSLNNIRQENRGCTLIMISSYTYSQDENLHIELFELDLPTRWTIHDCFLYVHNSGTESYRRV